MMPVRFVFKMMEERKNESFSSPHDAHIEQTQIEHAFVESIYH